jgi:hypothetical protein
VIAVSPNPVFRSEAPTTRPVTPSHPPGRTSLGIFAAGNGLRLLPFELRYLARTRNGPNPSRPGPDRWVIDIPAGTGELLPPHRYIEIPNIEDRLFVNDEHVPLFVELGWRRGLD